MRKTYPLRPEGKHPDRVLDAVKHDIRKYMKRERRRDLPEGAHFWDFDCRFGADQDSAQTVHPGRADRQLLDALAREGRGAVLCRAAGQAGCAAAARAGSAPDHATDPDDEAA
jgi:hypothetical protein